MPSDYFGLGGHVIDGQFHAIEVAGEGGFSVVYRGQHLSLREPIAIKCLKIQVKHNDPTVVASFTQRFFDESRIMYRLSQGNLDIARSVTSGVTMAPATGASVPYMVLEWLEGISLSNDLKDRRARKLGGRSLAETLALFEPAALAIGYAHSQGVVHRDVKPGNLFLHARREGVRMKVLDFGMAKVLSPETMGGLESAATIGGMVVVSPQYVTPEQFDTNGGAVGPWTDVYAFALILCEALTDRRAREGPSFADLLIQITQGPPPTPRALGVRVSDAIEGVFARALAPNVSERYADMNAFWSELTRAAAEGPKVSQDVTRVNVEMRDFAQTVGMPQSLPTAVREYLAQKPAPQQGAGRLGQTMPLATRAVAPAPAGLANAFAGHPFSGTLPLQSTQPTAPPAVHAAHAVPAAAPLQTPAPAFSPPAAIPPPAAAPPPAPMPMPMQPRAQEPAPGTSRLLVFFLLLFVLVALGVSGMLLYKTLVLHQ